MSISTRGRPLPLYIFLTLVKVCWRWRAALMSLSLLGYVSLAVDHHIGTWWPAGGLAITIVSLSRVTLLRRWISDALYVRRQQNSFNLFLHTGKFPLSRRPPVLRQVDRTLTGFRLTLQMRSGTAISELERLVPYLLVHYGVREARVLRDSRNGSIAYLIIVEQDPFSSAPIPFPSDDTLAKSIWAPIPLGIDEMGNQVCIALPERHLLIGGEPGSGKSVALSVVLASLVRDPTCQVFLFDGKAIELQAWRPLAQGFVGANVDAAQIQLNLLLELMEQRYLILGNLGARKVERCHGIGTIAVIIDELPFYVSNVDSKAAKQFASSLRDLIARGRAAGIVVIVAAQKPSADTVPSAIRDLISFRIAFRCATKEASDTVLGGGWASSGVSASTIAPRARGVGWLLDDIGVPRKIKTYWLSDQLISRLVQNIEQGGSKEKVQ